MTTPKPVELAVGQRIKVHRERAGKSRTVLGGLVGKSAEWVKAIETGRLLPPRLPMLSKIAKALRVPVTALVDQVEEIPDQLCGRLRGTWHGHRSSERVQNLDGWVIRTHPAGCEGANPMAAYTVVRLGGTALIWADCPMGSALAPRLHESLDVLIREGAYPIVVDLVRVPMLDDGVVAVLAAAAMRLGQRGYGLDLRLTGGRSATVRSAAQLRLVLAQAFPSAA